MIMEVGGGVRNFESQLRNSSLILGLEDPLPAVKLPLLDKYKLLPGLHVDLVGALLCVELTHRPRLPRPFLTTSSSCGRGRCRALDSALHVFLGGLGLGVGVPDHVGSGRGSRVSDVLRLALLLRDEEPDLRAQSLESARGDRDIVCPSHLLLRGADKAEERNTGLARQLRQTLDQTDPQPTQVPGTRGRKRRRRKNQHEKKVSKRVDFDRVKTRTMRACSTQGYSRHARGDVQYAGGDVRDQMIPSRSSG